MKKKWTNEHHPGDGSDVYLHQIWVDQTGKWISITVFCLVKKWLRYVWNVSICEMYTTTVVLVLNRPIGTLWICLLHV